MDKDFNYFWNAYRKKRGKQATVKQWDKLDAIDRKMVVDNVSSFIKANPDPKYRPDPERYLKHRRFEDETAPEKPLEALHPSHEAYVPPEPEVSPEFDTWAREMEDKFGVKPKYPTEEELQKGRKELGYD